MSNPVFFHADLSTDQLVLDGAEGRHAATVRRLRAGEAVDLVDGRGTRCTCSVTSVSKDALICAVVLRVVEPRPSPRITLVQALAKGGRGELAVELATEVGVDEFVPWAASRCIVQGSKGIERWRSTAHEAAKQCRRSWFPVVRDVSQTADLARLSGRLLVLHEEAPERLAAVELGSDDVVLVVGPEGGITSDELAALEGAGASVVRLGSSVLRTSTAGAAAAAVLSARVGRW